MKKLINNIRIQYNQHGTSQLPPLVFIHGFPFSQKMWEPQMQDLPNDFSAITYDIRGLGLSDVSDGQYTIELFVDDLIALLDTLAVEKAILCGLSMGGYIALRTIERHPDRICGLALCDTKSGCDTNEEKIKRTGALKTIKSAGISSYAEGFVKAVFWEKTFEKNPKAVQFIKDIILSNSPLGICGTLLALAARTDTTQSLTTIRVPTCIIVGEHDLRTPPSVAKEMHNAIIHSELHVLSDAAHMSNLENVKDFNRTLKDFLRKNWQKNH
jgi:3-oxoadipate enol-lactonase